MNNLFRDLNENYLGYGDPGGRFWFVGIEGAKPYGSIDEVHEELNRRKEGCKYFEIQKDYNKNAKNEYGIHYTKIYTIMSKIILGSSSINSKWNNNMAVSDYENNMLLQHGGDVFQMNLCPLGKPTEDSWKKVKDNYCRWFELQDEKQYLKAVEENRFDKMNIFWNEWSQKKITICFGKGHKEDFRKIFKFNNLQESKAFSDICYAPDVRLILTKQFSGKYIHWSDDEISEVARIAGSWIREGV